MKAKYKSGWSRNWSSRGTEMLARMDRGAKPLVNNYPPPRKMLRLLLDRYPKNKFFLSLNTWKGAFTEKQQQAIEQRYRTMQRSDRRRRSR